MPDDEKLEPQQTFSEEESAVEQEEVPAAADEAEPSAQEIAEEEETIAEPEAPKSKKNNAKKTALTYLHDLAYLLAAILIVFLVFLRVVVVSGPSMKNTLQNGDYLLLINDLFVREYKRGDIVVVSKDSFNFGEPIIKRVIATEGQTVNIDAEGVVTVDGVALDEPYISTDTRPLYPIFPLTVKEGHIFVLGDNRGNSKDSRSPEIGQIDCREVLGKAIFLIFPGANDDEEREFGRIGVID